MSLYRVVYFDGPTRANIMATGLMQRDYSFRVANLAMNQEYKPRATVVHVMPVMTRRLAIIGPRVSPERVKPDGKAVYRAGIG